MAGSTSWGIFRPRGTRDLYKGCVFPRLPNMLPPEQVAKQKPAWAEAFQLKRTDRARALLDPIHAGTQEEIRLRAAMMASVDEGVGKIFEVLERTGQLDNTFILFLGDNGYFFGEHALGPERRFAYEAGIRSPFVARFPRRIKPGTRIDRLVICQGHSAHADRARRRQARPRRSRDGRWCRCSAARSRANGASHS
jgi:arylsulfatase A-like enzyme